MKSETKSETKKPPRTGTNCKYSEAVVEKIARHIKAGQGRKVAASLAGITYQTLRNWEEGEGISPDQRLYLLDRLMRAEDEAEAAMVATIKNAARPHKVVVKKTKQVIDKGTGEVVELEEVTESTEVDVTAAMWWLERRRPDEYKKRSDVTSGDEPIKAFGLLDMSDDELAERAKKRGVEAQGA